MLTGAGPNAAEAYGYNALCLDAVHAAQLAGDAKTAAAANDAPARDWRVPEDWHLAGDRRDQLQALAAIVADNDDWGVADWDGFSAAAE